MTTSTPNQTPLEILAETEAAFQAQRAANAALRTSATLSAWTLWNSDASQVIVDVAGALRFGSVRGAIWTHPESMGALRTATAWEQRGNGPLRVLRLGQGLEENMRHLDSMLVLLAERRAELEALSDDDIQ
jgi:hypothetical protein